MAKRSKKSTRSKFRKEARGSLGQEKSRNAERDWGKPFFESSNWVEAGLFFIFTAFVAIICFLGQKPKGPQVISGHPAPYRVVAEFPFSYTSALIAEENARAVRAEVPPVFQRTFEPFEQFRRFIADLNSAIAKYQIAIEKGDLDESPDLNEEAVMKPSLTAIASELIKSYDYEIAPEVIASLTEESTPKERSALLNDAVSILRGIYEDGIYAARTTDTTAPQVTVIQLIDEEGRYNLPDARSLNDAIIILRVRLDSLSRDSEIARNLFEIFRAGLKSNLVYSAKGTNLAIERAIAQTEAPLIAFEEGDTLIEPGRIVTAKDIERINAYRLADAENGGDSIFLNDLFLKRLVLTIILLTATYIYMKQGLRSVYKRNRAIAVTAVSILLNLLVIRIMTELGEIALLNSRPSLGMLPYIAPYALAPITVAVLVGAAPAVLSALVVSVLFAIIQNNSVEFLLIAFVSGIVGSFVSLNIRKRAKLLRAGVLAGVTAALAGAAIAAFSNYSFGLVSQQMFLALLVGLLTGVLAVGLLPVFEQLFKITTEITLLELTDFNHPLLRRMQMEAPGSYHHSLMVANLSENAAASIGASPLLCRVCSFFHDIGKLVKPEYFVENQRDGINPHNEKNPSMSALVIKAHVKEGVELARKHKLPRVILDVIQQHHGTSLIQYFYFQAQKKQNDSTRTSPRNSSRPPLVIKVDESTYRYDGPKPSFKESAIIFFADGVEAASRSLKKVTQPAVEELIDSIISARIKDGQLDECPLTFKELHEIRSSFVYTLLNMLHARIEYPKESDDSKKDDPQDSKEEAPEAKKDETTHSGNQQPV